MKIPSILRLALLSLAWLAMLHIDGVSGQVTDARIPALLLPELEGRIAGNSTADFTQAPESVKEMDFQIPAGGSHINYGTIHTKVNTESADIATRSTSNADGLELKVDLTTAGGFRFQNGRNSVELEYQDQFGRQHYYNYLLEFESKTGSRGFTAENQSPRSRR